MVGVYQQAKAIFSLSPASEKKGDEEKFPDDAIPMNDNPRIS